MVADRQMEGDSCAELFSCQAVISRFWSDASAMGLRFLRIEPGSRSGFEAWLESLETQLQFRESAQIERRGGEMKPRLPLA
jgi:hypothetical protein